ncbi:MAG: amino acid permease, partial [Enterobacteriaceae bacterium]
QNPRTVLPRALNTIPIRFALFYILSIATIMMVTPWREISAANSPFVQLFMLVGLPAAAGIINFVVLTSAASSTNSGIYSNSRMLYGLAKDREAPGIFAKLSVRSVPSSSLVFSSLCLLGGAVLIYLVPNIVTAFTLVTTVSATLFIFVWGMILYTYIVYRRKRPELHAASSYKMPGGVFMCWVCLAFFAFVLVLLAAEHDTRAALMATPIWFVVLAIAWLCGCGKKSTSSTAAYSENS